MSFLSRFYLSFVSVLLLTVLVQGQTVLNGGFENTLATDCVYNPTTVVFDSLMPYVHFTPHRYLGADMITHGCINIPHIGDWCIGLASKGIYVDRISLKLSQPLNIGDTYELSYWTYVSAFTNGDSLLIGITTDTAQFGIQIGKALAPDYTWVQKTIVFTPTIAATDITAKLAWDDTFYDSWVLVDEFRLTNLVTGIQELVFKESVELYPNPATDFFILEAEEGLKDVQIELYNMNGQLLQSYLVDFLQQEKIDVSQLVTGVYTVRLKSGSKTQTLKLIKNQ